MRIGGVDEGETVFQLAILPGPQRAVWPGLAIPRHFVLYGGTALALRLGHRESVDFDFFTSRCFTSDQLFREIGLLADTRRIQESPNTLSVLKTIEGFETPVQFSFFGGLQLGQINSPDMADNGVLVASLLDLLGMKCATVSQRAEAKDYIDIYTVLTRTDFTLKHGIAAANAIYGRQYNAVLTLKALCFFADGNLPSLPDEIKRRLSAEVKQCHLEEIPCIHPETVIGGTSA